MNGSLRSRSRLIGLTFVVVVALSAMFAATASAKLPPIKESTVALGDSLAFGYSAQTFDENLPVPPPTAFEHGYANDYLVLHHYHLEGIKLVNLGCPGETTDSMIGNGPLGSILDPTEGESPCGYHKAGLALHTEYGGGKSQLEAMLEQIAIAAGSGRPATVVTLNIGANDELHAIAKCEAEVKSEIKPEEGKFFSVYGGKASSEAGITEATEAGVDGAEAEAAFGKGEVTLGLELKKEAEEDGAAAKADFEKAGLEAVKGCIEFHAEALFGHILHNIGSILFVLRNGSLFGGINYTGKIIFQGAYDPYANVYKTQEEVNKALAVGPQFKNAKLGEILPGSSALSGILNFHENKLVTDEGVEAAEEGHEPFKGCFAEVKPTFNPPVFNKEAGEKGTLQKYTNMNNQTSSNGQPNGPDIHPTKAGYTKLAQVMTAQCG